MSDYQEGTEWTEGVSDPASRETDGGDEVDVFVWTVHSSKPCSICSGRNGEEFELPASPTSIPNRIAVQGVFSQMKHTNCNCTMEYQGRRTNDALTLLQRTEVGQNTEIEEVNTDVILPPGGSQSYTNSDTNSDSHTSTDSSGATVSGGVSGTTGTVTASHSEGDTEGNSSTASETEVLKNETDHEQYVYERWKIITTTYDDVYKDGHEAEHTFQSKKVETIFLGRVNRDQ